MSEAKDLIKKMVELGNQDEEIKATLKGWGGTIQYVLNDEEFYVKYNEDGTAEFVEGKADNPNFTVKATPEYWLDVLKGKEDAVMGFMQGKYKIEGNFMEAQKLASALKKFEGKL